MIIRRHLLIYTLISSLILTLNTAHGTSSDSNDKTKYQYSPYALSEWGRWMCNTLDIWTGMVKHPTEISALTASNPFVINEIIKNIKGTKICELGAGTGPVTIPAIRQLTAENRLEQYYAIECVKEHHTKLSKKIDELKSGWPESNLFPTFFPAFNGIGKDTQVFTDHAFFGADWQPKNIEMSHNYIDTVISTLPWTRLSLDQINGILTRILQLLKQDGTLIWISLLSARTIGGLKATLSTNPEIAKSYFEKLLLIDSWLAKNFDQKVKTIWSNCSPMLVYCATRKQKID